MERADFILSEINQASKLVHFRFLLIETRSLIFVNARGLRVRRLTAWVKIWYRLDSSRGVLLSLACWFWRIVERFGKLSGKAVYGRGHLLLVRAASRLAGSSDFLRDASDLRWWTSSTCLSLNVSKLQTWGFTYKVNLTKPFRI